MSTERLYQLLPAVYRVRDVAQGESLRALLQVIEEQLQIVEADISGLYDNWFIETCDEWIVPYIGDVLGVRGLHPVTAPTHSERARVANTLGYRRRKGTATMLEQLARDVTGWPAHVVEFFEHLSTTQHFNHGRLGKGGTLDLGDANRLELLGGPFETAAHTADVRHIDNARGRYNIPNVGVFLWRLQSYPVTQGTAHSVIEPPAAPDGRFTFNPIGLDASLFSIGRTERDITHLAEEVDIPLPLRRRPLRDELEGRRTAVVAGHSPAPTYFGDRPAPVLEVFLDAAPDPLLPEQIIICDLSDWRQPASVEYTLPNGDKFRTRVAVDPVLGRIIALAGAPSPTTMEVSYASGFPGDLGGGPYDRQAFVESWLESVERTVDWQIGVTVNAGADPDLVTSLSSAVNAWNNLPAGMTGVIALLDSRSYREDVPTIEIKEGSQLLVIAADWPEDVPRELFAPAHTRGRLTATGIRPHIWGPRPWPGISVHGAAPSTSSDPGGLVIDGLLIEGSLTVTPGNLERLELWNSTLEPGKGGLTVTEAPTTDLGTQNERLTVTIKRSITGPVMIAPSVRLVRILDSIVDAPLPTRAVWGSATEISGSTILGWTDVQTLEASNTIFRYRVSVERRQSGCVRFSYLPRNSLVPRRYRCQPATEAAARRVVPRFTSITYGDPGYGQLAQSCPREILTGADDEDHIGAFHFLQEGQRLANLRASLDEYLRFGLEAGVLVET